VRSVEEDYSLITGVGRWSDSPYRFYEKIKPAMIDWFEKNPMQRAIIRQALMKPVTQELESL